MSGKEDDTKYSYTIDPNKVKRWAPPGLDLLTDNAKAILASLDPDAQHKATHAIFSGIDEAGGIHPTDAYFACLAAAMTLAIREDNPDAPRLWATIANAACEVYHSVTELEIAKHQALVRRMTGGHLDG